MLRNGSDTTEEGFPSSPSRSFWKYRSAALHVSQTMTIEPCGMHEIFNHPDAFEARPCGPRTFRPQRQRAKDRFVGDIKSPSARRIGNDEMEEVIDDLHADSLIDRDTLCLPDFTNDSIIHGGDERFKDALRQYFPSAESNATEHLVVLKSKLKNASTHDFWAILMEEMCDITGSQCGFVAKRMLVDAQDSAVEMPEIGEPGSCLMGVAFYVNNGSDVKKLYRDYQYHAYGSPCANMRHDKVFIIPERLSEFHPNNPNAMPWKQSEAFIGLPLFSKEKCFAHFGLIWSSDGASKRKLGWSFIEMFLHSLEDMILQRILEGRGFAKDVAPVESISAKVIPLSAITASQSLQPYARSLSHELRTPMQGVVGMLDIMYSTVLDAIANQQSERVREVFKDLKSHIETVQDSSRRALEAADNVVHAYDLNMQMPETPLTPVMMVGTPNNLDISGASSTRLPSPAQDSPSGKKRERTDGIDFHSGPPLKRMYTMTEAEILRKYYPESDISSCGMCGNTKIENATPTLTSSDSGFHLDKSAFEKKSNPIITPAILSPNHRRVVTEEFMKNLVTEALRNSHPTNEVHTETHLGETIEVRMIGSRGEIQDRKLYLTVESSVPAVIIVEHHHLQFALQKVVDNAIKFTDTGSITITVKMGKDLQTIEIWVVDTGCGITEESKLSLFKPHFQEDASLSRSRDGLGLSLFNAKAHVRKNLGGDITLERSTTDGPTKGSEFLIRLPITTFDVKNVDPPMVGTPPPGINQPSLPPAEMFIATSGSATSCPSLPTRQARPKMPQRRSTFNPNLAKEYPMNILIAEDNVINRNVAVGSLNKLGYGNGNVTVAFDGAEAVRHFQESLLKPPQDRFHAILMDIWMPVLDGFEATSQILDLARQNGTTTKIIAVTADITGECVSRAEEAGMQGFLAKPYKVLDIERIIVESFQKETR